MYTTLINPSDSVRCIGDPMGGVVDCRHDLIKSSAGRVGYAIGLMRACNAGSGVTTSHSLLAREATGMPGAALYPGSWSNWRADPARPVATSGA